MGTAVKLCAGTGRQACKPLECLRADLLLLVSTVCERVGVHVPSVDSVAAALLFEMSRVSQAGFQFAVWLSLLLNSRSPAFPFPVPGLQACTGLTNVMWSKVLQVMLICRLEMEIPDGCRVNGKSVGAEGASTVFESCVVRQAFKVVIKICSVLRKAGHEYFSEMEAT